MAVSDFDTALKPLEQSQEDALHASRLLPVEERPFQRVTKSLLGKDSFLRSNINHLPSPPPEGESEDEAAQLIPEYDAIRARKFREDILLDFASLESSIIRMQLILSSNQRERDRYAAEKAKILETAQAVRNNTTELRVQLAEAQQVLELRKGYDKLATKILDDKKLKSRDESRADIEKLEKEIEGLQDESAQSEGTWISRREQFDRMVSEGEAMIRLIQGIKDEPEPDKDETMEDGTKADTSRVQSPVADERSPRPTDAGDATPLPESGDAGSATPVRPANRFLEVDDATRTNSRVGSPLIQPTDLTQDDVEMEESVAVSATQATEHQISEITSEELEATAAQVDDPSAETMDET